MAWQLTSDLDAFDAAAGAFLTAEPTRNTVLISIPSVLRRRGLHAFGDEGTPGFGWLEGADGTVQAAFVHTPPHPMLLSDMPDGAPAELAETLTAAQTPLSAVNGPLGPAEAFAAAWCACGGRRAAVRMRHRLFVLGALAAPSPAPPGAARAAAAADHELLLRWYQAFAAEMDVPVLNAAQMIDDRLDYGGLWVWEADGVPVSMAGITRLLDGGGIRVGPVYTPKQLRGRGYAGAVTAAASQAALEAGAVEVSLFTDLANPTSNALYQRLGYRAIEDRVILEFEV